MMKTSRVCLFGLPVQRRKIYFAVFQVTARQHGIALMPHRMNHTSLECLTLTPFASTLLGLYRTMSRIRAFENAAEAARGGSAPTASLPTGAPRYEAHCICPRVKKLFQLVFVCTSAQKITSPLRTVVMGIPLQRVQVWNA